MDIQAISKTWITSISPDATLITASKDVSSHNAHERCSVINTLTCYLSHLFMPYHAPSRASAYSFRLHSTTRYIPLQYFHLSLSHVCSISV